jgi:hypothetical protein
MARLTDFHRQHGCTSATADSCRASAAARRGSVVVVAGRGPEASAAPCEAPLVVAASLAPARGALDERRLVGTDASALSTLAGASGGTVGATLRTWKQIVKPSPIEHATPRKATPYLKEEKARFLFLEVPADIAGAVGVAAATPPAASTAHAGSVARTGLSAACAGAPVVRTGTSAARAGSVVGRPSVGAPAPAPGDGSLATVVGSGDGGAGSHLSGRTCPLSSSSSSSSSDDEYSSVPGEESPCCSRSRNSSLLCSRRSRRRAFRYLLWSTHSCSRRCAVQASARDRGVGGSDRAAFTRAICRDRAKP